MRCKFQTPIFSNNFQYLLSNCKPAISFYQYLGAHSLLIGLLPFYLPVFLWNHDYGLQSIALLIGISGFSFCFALYYWQSLLLRRSVHTIVAITFITEFLLVLSVFTLVELININVLTAAALIGIANGLYNAFFWTTQRTLFLGILGNNNTGRQFGNFQIFVTVFLKIGILAGGLLLDNGGLILILVLSALLNFACWLWFRTTFNNTTHIPQLRYLFRGAFKFRDEAHSALTFRIDGIFLFLESHFWTLSLFILVREDYSNLGMVVVILASVFGLLFYLIKNRIDKYPKQQVYTIAVLLYSASWVLRMGLDPAWNNQTLLVHLIIVTFCTSFFRLAFNKRFFDHAKQGGGVEYLVQKSYVSQTYLAIFYFGLALAIALFESDDPNVLASCYASAAATALLFLAYKPADSQANKLACKS